MKAGEIVISELLTQIISIPAPFNMVVLIVLTVSACGVVTSIAAEIRRYASHRESLEIIRELSDRGMTVDEIERLLPEHREANEPRRHRHRMSACKGT